MRFIFFSVLVSLLAMTTSLNAADETTPPKPLPGAPGWLKSYEFLQQEFTFVRINYTSSNDRGRGRWSTDYPDADLNLSSQLAVQTSLKVDPKGKVMKLTDPKLSGLPFIYLCEPGDIHLTDEEIKGLRAYLEDGGFLMIDDFWGEREWQNLRNQLARVFPSVRIKTLPQEHEIFHCAFDLKEQPQVVGLSAFMAGRLTERIDAEKAHFRAIFDDEGRMQVLICHNTDLADGWERADVDARYFKDYSQKLAYPMGINAIFFALTQTKE